MKAVDFNTKYDIQQVASVQLFDTGVLDINTGQFVSRGQVVKPDKYTEDVYHIVKRQTDVYVGIHQRGFSEFDFSLDEIKSLISLFNETGKLVTNGQRLDYMTSPLVVFNQDETARNLLLFGREKLNYQYGALDFGTDSHIRPEGVDLDTLEQLVALRYIDIYEQRNDRPTVDELMRFMHKHSGFVLGGIITSDSVSFDSIRAVSEVSEQSRKAFGRFKRTADSFDGDNLYAWFD